MSRLIIVPQYPSALRYQEWWYTEFPKQLDQYFDEVIVIGKEELKYVQADEALFSPIQQAVDFELAQIGHYMALVLKPDDVLLLNDLSFPGLFTNVLLHKRPEKCFAICHATSKNKYDYFMNDRNVKYPIEKATARLFDKIFVGSKYHAQKLKWNNIEITPLPYPPMETLGMSLKTKNVVSASRICPQKRTISIEKQLERDLKLKIETSTGMKSWDQYYEFLSKSKVLLITAKEETFGYQIVDAILNGCIPIAPNSLSYPELLPKAYLYSNYAELKKIVAKIIKQNMPIFEDGKNKIKVPQLKTQKASENFYKIIAKHLKK